MKKSLNLIAAAALLGSTAIAPVAMAQDATAPAAPATEAPAASSTDSMSSDTSTQPLAQSETTDTYLTEQSATQVSANEFIGAPVYTGEDSIGDINDLIVEEDGRVIAAVIGVGGFLGIGEKNVALPMSKITISQNAEGDDLRLTTTETAETLKAAPEFATLEEQADASDSSVMPTDGTTTSSTGN